jgi:hypothetical protein
LVDGPEGGPIAAGCPFEVPLAPGLTPWTITANPPTDRHDREHEGCEHEEAEHDPEGDIGSGREADLSHHREVRALSQRPVNVDA